MGTQTRHFSRLPAEWEPQSGVLLAWPHQGTDWQPLLDEVIPVYLELVRRISRFEPVVILAPDTEEPRAELQCAGIAMDRVILCRVPTNDTWIRDFGPITVETGNNLKLLDFGFNGWGLKFAADQDNQATRRLHDSGCLKPGTGLEIPGLVLEGGSIETDGCGTLLTTAQCLLGPNRNPHLVREDLEDRFSELFGSSHVLWLEHGYLAGDDTDAHIDTLARLAPEETILYMCCDDPRDEHYTELQAMEKELTAFRTAHGKPFRLLPLPWPCPCFSDGERLPATYANFLVINDAVLVPLYRDAADQGALQVIADAYPGREIIGVDCLPLIKQHGSLHCVTMQLPQGVL